METPSTVVAIAAHIVHIKGRFNANISMDNDAMLALMLKHSLMQISWLSLALSLFPSLSLYLPELFIFDKVFFSAKHLWTQTHLSAA